MARVLITVGFICVVIGVLWLVFPKALSWFGRLPGDIHIQRDNIRVSIPWVSMLVVSVGLTLLTNAVAWLLKMFRG
ncbi:MAG: DUF2905 domain-containing protein [Trueperaceae bacterium]